MLLYSVHPSDLAALQHNFLDQTHGPVGLATHVQYITGNTKPLIASPSASPQVRYQSPSGPVHIIIMITQVDTDGNRALLWRPCGNLIEIG